MEETQLSAAEAELYDRQIRLWGIESQEKLRAANVLLIGIRALGSEIAKNILLSGINSLTILDDGAVTPADISTNFLLNHDTKLGTKVAEEVLLKAQALNPLVKITADTSSLASKPTKFFQSFTIVVATGIKFESILKIDNVCREAGVKFIYGDVFGMFGFSVADFIEHDYFEDRITLTGKKRAHDANVTEKTTVKVQGNLSYPPINKVLILPNTKQDVTKMKKIRRPSSLFVCMLTLIEFRKRHDRNPSIDRKAEDVEEMKSIAADILALYRIENLTVDDQLYDLIFGEVTPVCAILGGVIAQEVIKAVSHKEVTINNVFLFDPVTYAGKELALGA